MQDDYSGGNILEYKVRQLEKKVEHIEGEMKEIERAEKQKLRWGVSFLGSALLAVVGVLWSYRGVIFK